MTVRSLSVRLPWVTGAGKPVPTSNRRKGAVPTRLMVAWWPLTVTPPVLLVMGGSPLSVE